MVGFTCCSAGRYKEAVQACERALKSSDSMLSWIKAPESITRRKRALSMTPPSGSMMTNPQQGMALWPLLCYSQLLARIPFPDSLARLPLDFSREAVKRVAAANAIITKVPALHPCLRIHGGQHCIAQARLKSLKNGDPILVSTSARPNRLSDHAVVTRSWR